MAHAEICPVCKGSGRIGSERHERRDCHGCGGKGWVEVGSDDSVVPWPIQSYYPQITYLYGTFL